MEFNSILPKVCIVLGKGVNTVHVSSGEAVCCKVSSEYHIW